MRAAAVLVSVAAAGLALCACHPAKMGERRNERPLLVSSRLMCPERQGELTRSEEAGDGRSCRYAGEDGAEVTLQLASLDGRTPQAALADMEAKLKAETPQLAARGSESDETGAKATANAVGAKDDDGDKDGDEHTTVNLPFLHIETQGDHARVNLPGVHINANGDKAEVQVNKPGGKLVSVHADDQGAEIRMGDITAKNVDATYILARKGGDADGEHAVGYVAKGPVAGPLVVALVKSRSEDHDAHNLFRSVHKLVSRNIRRGSGGGPA